MSSSGSSRLSQRQPCQVKKAQAIRSPDRPGQARRYLGPPRRLADVGTSLVVVVHAMALLTLLQTLLSPLPCVLLK